MWSNLQEWWPLVPMTEDDARRMLSIQNKHMLKNKDPKIRSLWEFGQANFEELVKDLMSRYNQKWTEILDSEWNW